MGSKLVIGCWLLVISFLFILPMVSSAHWITGYVDGGSGTGSANNKVVTLWNFTSDGLDNASDVVGPNGNSYTDDFYLIDCEMLATPCIVGDVLSVGVFEATGEMLSSAVNVLVTGAGYNIAPNLTLNVAPEFEFVLVDDSFNLTVNEIDLATNFTREVVCEGVAREYEGQVLSNAVAEFYDTSNSFIGDTNDNNKHYSNSSCEINNSYGDENQSKITCSFDVWYYANVGNWNCQMRVDDPSSTGSGIDDVNVNPLLSLEIQEAISFGNLSSQEVSNESEVVILNRGNVEVDLNLYGYGSTPGDNLAMNWSTGNNLPVYYEKYNLASSIFGDLTLGEFEINYNNLTSNIFTNNFNLQYRQNDLFEDAYKSTYWRVYVPEKVGGVCEGNIVFGAVMSV
jgi:hypothetical protein